MGKYKIWCGNCEDNIGETSNAREAQTIADNSDHQEPVVTTRFSVTKVFYSKSEGYG